jgi:hypothetical protein
MLLVVGIADDAVGVPDKRADIFHKAFELLLALFREELAGHAGRALQGHAVLEETGGRIVGVPGRGGQLGGIDFELQITAAQPPGHQLDLDVGRDVHVFLIDAQMQRVCGTSALFNPSTSGAVTCHPPT